MKVEFELKIRIIIKELGIHLPGIADLLCIENFRIQRGIFILIIICFKPYA